MACEALSDTIPGPGIGGEDGLQVGDRPGRVLSAGLFDQHGNTTKGDSFLKKGTYRNLVGGIENRRHCAAGTKCVIGETEAGKAVKIGGKEFKPTERRQVERRQS